MVKFTMKTQPNNPVAKAATHTPGPWTFRGPIVFSDFSCVASCDFGASQTVPVSEAEANARLIAAAPELLEACRQALFAIPTTHGAFQTIAAAIAKAEGRA